MDVARDQPLYTLPARMEKQVYVQERNQKLDRFLASVERQAFRMAAIATRHNDDALDIVQDTMIKLVEKYASKPEDEWRPLFFTILQSRITDYHRKRTLTGKLFSWIKQGDNDETLEPLDTSESLDGPLEMLMEALTIERLERALASLPVRQQQVFLLRTWQGFSVAETAKILGCGEGSVKTHLSRATEALMKSIEQDVTDD